jgi:hypothetical protein
MLLCRESASAEDEGEGHSHVPLALHQRQTPDYRNSDRMPFQPKAELHISRRMASNTPIPVNWEETLICVSAPRHVKFSRNWPDPI